MIARILLMQVLFFTEINPRQGEDQTYQIAPNIIKKLLRESG
jgi:hypothetical protein